jgi:ADP-ribose pyrophosphatase
VNDDAKKAARIVSQKRVFKRYHALDIIEAEPRSLRHDGYTVKMEREIFRMRSAVVILLYNPHTDEILLNQQFRLGAFMSGAKDPVMLECAAGMIDEGEAPEQTARREALEETGCEVGALEFVGVFYPSPSCVDETLYLYAGCIEKAEAGFYGLEEEGEEIKTYLMPSAEVIALLDANTITNGPTAILLHWFARHRDRLRREWTKK